MAGKKVSLTPQGHRVQGALATYLVPLLAADQALQSSELESLCKSITPNRYDKQIEGIVGTVKERFGARLAQDANLDNLRKILSALMPSSLALDKQACDDDDGGDAMPPAFLKNIKKKKKAADSRKDDEEDNEDFEDFEDDDQDDAEDTKEGAAKQTNLELKNAEGDQDNEEEEQWVGPTKARKAGSGPVKGGDSRALDAALGVAMDTARREGAALAERRIGAKFEAAAAVKPIVGEVNVFACDSAAAIYKMALDAKGVDLTGVPPIAYKAVLREVLKRGTDKAPVNKFAQDASITKNLLEEFPALPARV